MASGSSKEFAFASDEILNSYNDHTNQEQQSMISDSDSAIATKEFNQNRHDSDDQEEVIILAVERCMKKHTDKVMRFLEDLSSRLSQVELYCCNLDKSMGQMQSDMVRDHGEANTKVKFLEKHLQEVHRSLQIWMIDLQVADTEKELTKLQLAQKESSSRHSSQQTNDRSSTPDAHKKGHSTNSQPQRALEPQAYYLPPTSTQYQQSQMQPQPLQQQWEWTMQAQPPPTMLSPQDYLPTKPHVNHHSSKPLPISLPMQMTSYSTIRSNQLVTYSHSGPGPLVRIAQPLPPPPQFETRLSDGCVSPNPYMVYHNASRRVQQAGSFYQQQSGGRNHHPYDDVVDKLVSMGYRGDHVVGVIQRMDEAGEIVDFNAVLDRLNEDGSQRGC